MGAGDHGAVGKTLAPDHSEGQRLAAVAAVDLHAGLESHAGLILDKAVFPGELDGVDDRLTLRSGVVQEAHVAAAVFLRGGMLVRIDQVVAVFLLVEQVLSHVIHVSISP